jgi:hypothetical protein
MPQGLTFREVPGWFSRSVRSELQMTDYGEAACFS